MTDLPYRAIWERELRAGMYGQDRMRPSTWRIDSLYRAVLWQIKAEELEGILELALEQNAHSDTIESLVNELDGEIDMVHKIFLGGERDDAAA